MVVVMPFAGEQPGTGLVDRKIATVKIDPFTVFFLSAAMTGVVKGPDPRKPKHRSRKDRTGQTRSAEEIKNGEPKAPVEQPDRYRIKRMSDRPPFLILFI